MTTSILRRAAAVTSASALVLTGLIAAAGNANAAVPGFEPDTANQYGQLTFYDARGTKVTSGAINDAPFAAYAVATSDDPTTANYKATLYGYAANSAAPINAWSGKQMTLSSSYPVTDPMAPTVVTSQGSARPVVTLSSSSVTLAGLQTAYPNGSDAKYPNIYQLRVKTSGSINSTKWWAADIQISGSAWQQVYPDVPQKAVPSVALSASPAGSAYKGQNVTFTAAITNGGAGTVQFAVDGTNKGAPVAVSGGQASVTFNDLSPNGGARSITAAYSPTDTTAYTPATSPALSYTIKDKPFITGGPSVNGTARVGQTVSCAASADDSSATRATTWFLNGGQVATGDTYGIGEGDYGKALSCAVTFTNPAGATSATSDAVGVGIGPNLRITRLPRFRGALLSGKKVYLIGGSYAPAATGYAYQWFFNGRAVRGATRSYFTVPKKSRGKLVSVRVTARRYGYGDSVVVLKAKVRK